MAKRTAIEREKFDFDEEEHGLTVELFDAIFIGLMDNEKITAESADIREHSLRLLDSIEEAVEKAIDDSDLSEDAESLYLDGLIKVVRSAVSQLDENDLLSGKVVVNTIFEYTKERWEALNDILGDDDEDEDDEELN